jgi:hypothetical protein
MVIKEGEPWLLWPDMISFGINRGDIYKTFEGETDFTISMRVKIISKEPHKRTLFAKLPNYMGIDVEGDKNRLLFIGNYIKDNVVTPEYEMIDGYLNWDYNFITINYSKEFNSIKILINDINVFEHNLGNKQLTTGHEPHIVFGAGNFPRNGFNLNYCSYDMDYLIIAKKSLSYTIITDLYNKNIEIPEEVIGLYDFNKKTDFKINDLTGNCNFLHKII